MAAYHAIARNTNTYYIIRKMYLILLPSTIRKYQNLEGGCICKGKSSHDQLFPEASVASISAGWHVNEDKLPNMQT